METARFGEPNALFGDRSNAIDEHFGAPWVRAITGAHDDAFTPARESNARAGGNDAGRSEQEPYPRRVLAGPCVACGYREKIEPREIEVDVRSAPHSLESVNPLHERGNRECGLAEIVVCVGCEVTYKRRYGEPMRFDSTSRGRRRGDHAVEQTRRRGFDSLDAARLLTL